MNCESLDSANWLILALSLLVLFCAAFDVSIGPEDKRKEYLLQRFSCGWEPSSTLWRHVCDQKDCDLFPQPFPVGDGAVSFRPALVVGI